MVKQQLNSLKCVFAYYSKALYPTQFVLAATIASDVDNDATMFTSNTSDSQTNEHHHALAMFVRPSLAVANTGVTLLFLTKGALCQNKQRAVNPIMVTMHICNITIPGLPMVLTGHIMPDMTTTSLFRIRFFCKAGCQVLFNNDTCQVIYEGNVILTGYKDPISDVWMLPVLPIASTRTALDALHQSPLNPCLSDAPHETANFSYHCTMKENNMKYMHQSLCIPPKSSLLVAIRQGFLRGATHLTDKAVAKYLPPSPATSKAI